MKVFILSLDKEVVECFDSMEKVDKFLKEEWFVEDGVDSLDDLEEEDIVLDILEVK